MPVTMGAVLDAFDRLHAAGYQPRHTNDLTKLAEAYFDILDGCRDDQLARAVEDYIRGPETRWPTAGTLRAIAEGGPRLSIVTDDSPMTWEPELTGEEIREIWRKAGYDVDQERAEWTRRKTR